MLSNTVLTRWSIGSLSDPVVLVAISLVLLAVALAAAAIQPTAPHRFSRRTHCGSIEPGEPDVRSATAYA